MQYSQGRAGRIFVAKIEHGDDLLEELERLVEQERIEAAVLYLIGALRAASLVAGPEACAVPPVPIWRSFDDCREVLAIGTMFRSSGQPVFHLHSALGRGDTTLAGCIRGSSEVYLLVEVIIMELLDTGALKEFDPDTELKMLVFHAGLKSECDRP